MNEKDVPRGPWRQPPWRAVQVCKTPDTSKATEPCGYKATTCDGEAATCETCGYSYCARHMPSHVKTYDLPRDAFKAFVRWVNDARKAREAGGKGTRPDFAEMAKGGV